MSIGKIGTADLAAGVTAYSDLTSGGIGESMIANVCLCNRGAASVKVRIAIGTGTSAASADFLEYDTVVPANGVLERTGLAITTGEKIWVSSDTATVSARAHGLPAS